VGVEAEDVRRWRSLDARHQQSIDLTRTGLQRTESVCEPWMPGQCWRNDQLITKVPTLRAYATFTNDFHYVMSRHPALRASASGNDRMWFAPVVARVPVTDTVFAAFLRRTDSLGAPPLVVHTRAQMLDVGSRRAAPGRYSQFDSMPAARRVPVQLLDYQPNELMLRLSAPDSGWLMVTERWAPGWRATVNGQPTPTFGANFIFRAVPVRRGENVIRFVYRPAGFPWLVAASWLALACVVGWSAFVRDAGPRATSPDRATRADPRSRF
jgi:Bacterial membrane protein YfhO